MEKKLENIFVTYEIAKLAYEKGFREWCACLVSKERGHTPNFHEKEVDGYIETLFDLECEQDEIINEHNPCPTHFQLISWLRENHEILIILCSDKTFEVELTNGDYFTDGDNLIIDINKAIEIALNILPYKQ